MELSFAVALVTLPQGRGSDTAPYQTTDIQLQGSGLARVRKVVWQARAGVIGSSRAKPRARPARLFSALVSAMMILVGVPLDACARVPPPIAFSLIR